MHGPSVNILGPASYLDRNYSLLPQQRLPFERAPRPFDTHSSSKDTLTIGIGAEHAATIILLDQTFAVSGLTRFALELPQELYKLTIHSHIFGHSWMMCPDHQGARKLLMLTRSMYPSAVYAATTRIRGCR